MVKGKWAVVVLFENTPLRNLHLSPRAAASLIGALVLLIAAVFFFAGGGTHRLRAEQLAKKNEVMVRELADIREQVANLENTVDELAGENARTRSLAGLEPLDAEVLQVGVGGPGTITPTTHPLWGIDSAYSQDAFATRYDLTALHRRAELLGASLDKATDALVEHREWMEALPSILPAHGYISSSFSAARMHPVHHLPLPHEGVDISAEHGTPIAATANGRVSFTGRRPGYGLTVMIEHGFGYETVYGHASQILVRKGEDVKRGDVIALVGSTGISTSSHVHYEVRRNGVPANPLQFVISSLP